MRFPVSLPLCLSSIVSEIQRFSGRKSAFLQFSPQSPVSFEAFAGAFWSQKLDSLVYPRMIIHDLLVVNQYQHVIYFHCHIR